MTRNSQLLQTIDLQAAGDAESTIQLSSTAGDTLQRVDRSRRLSRTVQGIETIVQESVEIARMIYYSIVRFKSCFCQYLFTNTRASLQHNKIWHSPRLLSSRSKHESENSTIHKCARTRKAALPALSPRKRRAASSCQAQALGLAASHSYLPRSE